MIDDECLIDATEPEIILPRSLSTSASMLAQRSRSGSDPYKNLIPIKALNKGKFPVFLVRCESLTEKYAMKLFLLEDEQAQDCFQNEIRFGSLQHPNIIRTVHTNRKKTIMCKDASLRASLILTEYAPHGDLHSFIQKYSEDISDKLARTYFHQLIEGMEYLHNKNIVHLDIKPENLLIGENYILKIADFDLSQFTTESTIYAKGTECYRAPELAQKMCQNGIAADIYSAGVLLFVLKTGGKLPYNESKQYKGIDFFNLFHNDNSTFWKKQCEIQRKHFSFFRTDFKGLIIKMMKFKPEERATIEDIKRSSWYNGPVYTPEELVSHLQDVTMRAL